MTDFAASVNEVADFDSQPGSDICPVCSSTMSNSWVKPPITGTGIGCGSKEMVWPGLVAGVVVDGDLLAAGL